MILHYTKKNGVTYDATAFAAYATNPTIECTYKLKTVRRTVSTSFHIPYKTVLVGALTFEWNFTNFYTYVALDNSIHDTYTRFTSTKKTVKLL